MCVEREKSSSKLLSRAQEQLAELRQQIAVALEA